MSIDYYILPLALLFAALFWFLKKRKAKFQKGVFYFSELKDLITPETSSKVQFAWIPKALIGLSAALFMLAFIDPHSFVPRAHEGESRQDPVEGKIFFLVVDQSGSMREDASLSESKLDLMKREVSQFITARPQDLIGLISFARTAQILSPPTFDHANLLKEMASLETVPSPDLDGTSIGYAIFKAANLISSLKEQAAELGTSAPYQIKGSFIVLVTDGLQDPNPLDKENPFRSMELSQAAAYAKEKKVKVYIINIEPKLSSAKFLPNLREMRKITELTGGEFYHTGSTEDLGDFVAKINQLESSKIFDNPDASRAPTLFKKISYFSSLLIGAALLFFAGVFLRETYFTHLTG